MDSTPAAMLVRQNTTVGADLPMPHQEDPLGRIRDEVVKAMPQIKQNVILIDIVSRRTGSDSMPGDVLLQIEQSLALLTALKAAVEVHG